MPLPDNDEGQSNWETAWQEASDSHWHRNSEHFRGLRPGHGFDCLSLLTIDCLLGHCSLFGTKGWQDLNMYIPASLQSFTITDPRIYQIIGETHFPLHEIWFLSSLRSTSVFVLDRCSLFVFVFWKLRHLRNWGTKLCRKWLDMWSFRYQFYIPLICPLPERSPCIKCMGHFE